MTLLDELRSWMDDSVGNAGALRNCRVELDRRREIDRAVRRLQHAVSVADTGAAKHRKTA